MAFVIAFLFSVLTSASGTIMLKIGSLKIGGINLLSSRGLWAMASNLYFVSGMALYVLSFPAYAYVLQKINANVAYPMFTGANFILIVFLSILFLKETVSWVQFLGMAFIIGGIILLAKGK